MLDAYRRLTCREKIYSRKEVGGCLVSAKNFSSCFLFFFLSAQGSLPDRVLYFLCFHELIFLFCSQGKHVAGSDVSAALIRKERRYRFVLGVLCSHVMTCTLCLVQEHFKYWSASVCRTLHGSLLRPLEILSDLNQMRMVRWCIRLTRLTLVSEVIRYRLVQVRQNLKKKKKDCGLAARNRLSLSLPLSFSSSSYFLSFSKTKIQTFRVCLYNAVLEMERRVSPGWNLARVQRRSWTRVEHIVHMFIFYSPLEHTVSDKNYRSKCTGWQKCYDCFFLFALRLK